MQLVDPKRTYEVRYEEEGVPVEQQAVFILRRLSGGEVNMVTDEITVSRGESNTFAYLGGTEARLMIQKAVVDWRNVTDAEGHAAPCNDSTKELLEAKVQKFLHNRIAIDNGLKKTPAKETEEKN